MADIYKTKEIETNINERGVNLGNVDVTLYTMDKGSAAFKIHLKREVNYGNEKVYDSVNLYTADMTPRIDIVAADGSTFAYEPVDVVIPESGVIQYVVSDYVIRHAGKMDVYIYLENKSESVQVANFYFYIEEDGVAKRLGKEIIGGRLEDVVKDVMSGQLMGLLSEDFRDQLDKEIKAYLKENNKDFNLKFDDLTREEKNELIKNLTNQGLADFTIEDNSIGNVKLVDGTITPEKTAFFTKTKTSNLFDLDTLEKGKTVDTNGDVINDDIRWLTGYIPLDSALGEQINFTKGTYRIAMYDANKKFVIRTGVTNSTYYVPASSTGTKYVRISGVGDYSNMMINKGSSLYPYESPTKSKEGYKLNPSLYEQFDFKDGIVDTPKIKNQAVTPEKVSFISEEQTNNLINLATVSRGVSIDESGNIVDDIRWLTDYIPLDSALGEQINFTQGTYRIGLYDSNKNFIIRAGVTNSTYYKPVSSTGTKYVRISGTTSLDTLMVNKGSSLLPYEAPKTTTFKKIQKELIPKITDDMTSFIKEVKSKNLFDSKKVLSNTSVDTDGTIISDDKRWLSDFIPVNSSQNEQVNFTNGTYRIALYDKDKKFVIRSGVTNSTSYKPASSTGTQYVRISGIGDYSKIMVNKGGSLLPYEEYFDTQTLLDKKFINHIKPEQLDIFDIKTSNNILSSNDIIKNTSIDTDGTVISDDVRWLSDFIELDASQNEQINFTQGTYRIGLYDSNKKFIIRSGVTDATSYQPNPTTFAKYVRISGTIDPSTVMVNKGPNLLPFEKPYGTQIKLKQEYLPSLLGNDSASGTLQTSELAKIEQNIQTYTPNIPKLDFEEVTTGYYEALWLSKDGKRIYGKQGARLWVSYDECETFTTIIDDTGISVQAVRELDDGELIFSTERDVTNHTQNGRVFKTKGFDKETGMIDSYDLKVETPSTESKINNSWGITTYKNVVTLSEYGLRGEEGARRAWLSTDYGETFKVIFDQKETTKLIKGAPIWTDTAHMHTCAFDPYWNRIWIVTGDRPNSATYYSDDFGETWKWVDVQVNDDTMQLTGILALPNCVIFGSDRAPNGVFVYYRGNKSDTPVIEPLLLVNDKDIISHIFQIPFKRDWDSLTPVYFGAPNAGDTDNKSICVATVDGKKAFIIHENNSNEKFGGKCSAFLGDTAQGNIIGTFFDSDISGYRIGKAKAPTWTKL